MELRKGAGPIVSGAITLVTIAVLGICIVASNRLLDAITGLDHRRDESTIAGLPLVLLIAGPVLSASEFFQAPDRARLAKLRWTAVRCLFLALVLAPVTALCIVAFGHRIDSDDAAFWGAAVIQFTVILGAIAVLKRSRWGRPTTAAKSP